MAERLIDAEAFGKLLINRMNTIAKEQLERCPADVGIAMGVVLGIKDLLDSQSTIEAKPVVRAHWEWVKLEDGRDYFELAKCSKCGAMSAREYPYCRECGAQMDEKESD